MLKKHTFRTYYYGNFASESGIARETSRVDPANPGDTVWRTFDHRPRFGNNYVGLRNRLAILSEAYSYLDFRGRVRVTEVFVEEALQGGRGQRGPRHRADGAARRRDEDVRQPRRAREARPPRRRRARPWASSSGLRPLAAPVEILVGDVDKRLNPRSGSEMLVMSGQGHAGADEGLRNVFEATRTAADAARLADSARRTSMSGRYSRRHRSPALARSRRADASPPPAQIDVERFVVATVTKAERPFQGHHEARLTGKYAVGEAVGAGGRALHSRRPAARAAGVLSARAGKRRRPRDVEPHRSRPRAGRDVSDLSRGESDGTETRAVKPVSFQLPVPVQRAIGWNWN